MKSRHFPLQAFVAPEIYDARKEAAWELINPKIILIEDTLVDQFGEIIINNWHAGGSYKESGLRNFLTPTGAKYSMHKLGGACDNKPQKVTPQEMYEYILKNPDKFPYITTLENIDSTPTWVHVDCRNNQQPGIRVVNP